MSLSNANGTASGTSFDDDAHPLRIGDTVAVLALDGSGHVWLEGQASIITPCAQPHVYRVRFQNEKRDLVRFVNPDWQSDPERSLELLREFFRSNQDANPSVTDFFPDDID
jgi:hypothetical protein